MKWRSYNKKGLLVLYYNQYLDLFTTLSDGTKIGAITAYQLRHDFAMENSAVRRLLRELVNHDDTTCWHSIHVADIMYSIYEREGSDEELCEQAWICGLLHDIGKLAVPRELLQAKRSLTDKEREIMQRHVECSYQIVMCESKMSEVAKHAVLYHHIRADGLGYPEKNFMGFKYFNSKMQKRIHLCDILEARLSVRPYREAEDPVAVLDDIANNHLGTDVDEQAYLDFKHLIPVFRSGETLLTEDNCFVEVLGWSDNRRLDKPNIKVVLGNRLHPTGTHYDMLDEECDIVIKKKEPRLI